MKPNGNGKYVVGVDLGGTNVRAAVADREGNILGEGRRPSRAMEGFDITIVEIIQAINDAILAAGVQKSDLCGIGMGVPGRHISGKGVVLWSPNFKDWAGVQLLEPIEEEFGVAAYMGNDVNVAALGEFRFGAGKDVNSMVMMTLGTGIGGGIILNGKLWLGANEGGGEIGHQIINPNGRQCGCGRFGDLESEASISAIVERAQRMLRMGYRSVLPEMGGYNLEELTPEIIAQAADEGDAVATEVMRETGFWVGMGIANAINFLNVEMVAIGGGVSRAGEVLWGPIMDTVKTNALVEALEVCQVVPSVLGDDAGIMGGLVLVLQAMEESA